MDWLCRLATGISSTNGTPGQHIRSNWLHLTQLAGCMAVEIEYLKMLCLRLSHAKSLKQIKYTLQETTSHSYLGVEITNNLKWGNHVYTVRPIANRAVDLLDVDVAFIHVPKTSNQQPTKPLFAHTLNTHRHSGTPPPPVEQKKKTGRRQNVQQNICKQVSGEGLSGGKTVQINGSREMERDVSKTVKQNDHTMTDGRKQSLQ